MNAPRVARRIALAVTLMVAGWGCSSNTRKDQHYGTDVGANWIPPDATARDAPVNTSAADASDGGEAGTTDAVTDAADASDDASMDAGASADARRAISRTLLMGSTDRVVQWRGGSLDELVGMLSGPALAARIEVVIPEGGGRPDRVVGEVHMVAGGVADAISGELRGEDALEQLKRLPMAHFRVEPCVPEPESGGISPPGPEEGQLSQRSLAKLMQYCEQYAMTCLLEVWQGGQQATINYRKGEIVSTTVDGHDGAEQLPEVMTWAQGQYHIVLPPLVLPAPPRAPKPASSEQRTLFGYVSPIPVAAAEPPRRSESLMRDTFPIIPPAAHIEESGHRPTRPGLPVDIYDAAVPERVTDVGVPAIPGGDPDKTPLPAPSEPRLPASPPAVLTTLPDRGPVQHRVTAPGFTPAKPESVPTLSGSARESRPLIQQPRTHTPRRVAVRRRTLSDLPVVVHVGLGLALGLAIVGAYWVAQGFLPH